MLHEEISWRYKLRQPSPAASGWVRGEVRTASGAWLHLAHWCFLYRKFATKKIRFISFCGKCASKVVMVVVVDGEDSNFFRIQISLLSYV